MAGGLSDAGETTALNAVFGGTLYLALYTVAPDDTGGGTEVSTSGTAYARQAATFTVSGTAPSQAALTAQVEFPAATASWGTIVGIAVWTAASGGTMRAWATLDVAKTINLDDIYRAPAGTGFKLTID